METSKSVRESRLWAWLRSNTKAYFKHNLHMHRVENSATAGMPDVEGCLNGNQFWIELKCCARPATATSKIKSRFQSAQLPWLKDRIRAGGRAFVLIQVGSGTEARRYLIPGNSAGILADGCQESKLHRICAADPSGSAVDIICAASSYGDF